MSTIKDFFSKSEANDPMGYFDSLINEEIVHLRILENDSHTQVDDLAKLKHLIKIFNQHRDRLVSATRIMNNFTKWQVQQLHNHLQTLDYSNQHIDQATDKKGN